MNKIYRVIWSHTLRCLIVVSELASTRGKSKTLKVNTVAAAVLMTVSPLSHALSAQLVDNTTANYQWENIVSPSAQSAMLVRGAEGNVVFSDGYISASAPTANAVQVEGGASFDIRNSTMDTLSTATMSALGGSNVTITNSQLNSLAGPAALTVGDKSSVNGDGVTLHSSQRGLMADNARVDLSNVTINSGIAGIRAVNGSQIALKDATITTTANSGYGITVADSTVKASNINITTAGAEARGVLASGANTLITLDGGSISTRGANGHAIHANNSSQVNVSNMNLTTTALRQAGDSGAAAIFIEGGATVNVESSSLQSAGSAIWMRAGTLNGNNLQLSHTNDSYGPIIWGFSGSNLNLSNSVISLGNQSGSQGISVDAGRANLDGVRIEGDGTATGIFVNYNATLTANNLDIAINNSNGTGVGLTGGSGRNSATLVNSRVVVNGENGTAIAGRTSSLQTINLSNTLIASDNVAAKVYRLAGLQINADASTLSGKMLMQGGTANSSDDVASFIRLNATNGSLLSGDAVIDHQYTRDSLLALDTGTEWQGAAQGLHKLTLDNASRWVMNGDSEVGTVNLANSQIAFMHADEGFKTLTVDGNFTSDNGVLVLNSIEAGDESAHDQLIVKGNYSGNTHVVVNKAGGAGAATIQGIELISVAGEANGEFTQQGRIVAGAYDYHLLRGTGENNKNWYLFSGLTPPPAPTPDPGTGEGGSEGGGGVIAPLPHQKMTLRPEVGNYIANMAATNTLFNLRLHDRGGETQYVDALTGEQKTTSMWMRNLGGHQQMMDSSGQLKTETNRYVLQMGGDMLQGSINGTDSLHVGAMAGYGNARSNTDSSITGYRSQGHTTGYSLGVYGTWYQQPQQQTGAYVDSWLQYSWFNNSVNGDHLSAERYGSRGVTASVESGYKWKLGEDGWKNSYFIEPNAQFIWMNVKADDVVEANGTRVSSQGAGNIQSRLGVRASMQTSGEKDQAVFKPFLEANWINNSKSFGSTLNDVTVNSAGNRNMAEMRVGVDGQLKSNLNVWGSVGQQMGSDRYRDSVAAVGVKISF